MKGNNIIVEILPEKEAVEKFWKEVWPNKHVLMTKQTGYNNLKKLFVET